jgi:vacuolar-type H+-ATPase subunit I/STV1
MNEPTLNDRVQILEGTVKELAVLPTRVEALELQIVQLREEMRGEFSAARQEISVVRQEIRDGDEETRRYMRVLHEEVLARIATLAEGWRP